MVDKIPVTAFHRSVFGSSGEAKDTSSLVLHSEKEGRPGSNKLGQQRDAVLPRAEQEELRAV